MTREARRGLDWPLIVGLGASGAVPATLAVFRLYGPAVELFVWTLLALVWVPIAMRRGIRSRILHMVLVGAVAGLMTGAIQAPLAHVMFANDAALAEAYGGVATLGARAQILAVDFIIGLTWGLLVGLSWAGAAAVLRAWNKKRGVMDAT